MFKRAFILLFLNPLFGTFSIEENEKENMELEEKLVFEFQRVSLNDNEFEKYKTIKLKAILEKEKARKELDEVKKKINKEFDQLNKEFDKLNKEIDQLNKEKREIERLQNSKAQTIENLSKTNNRILIMQQNKKDEINKEEKLLIAMENNNDQTDIDLKYIKLKIIEIAILKKRFHIISFIMLQIRKKILRDLNSIPSIQHEADFIGLLNQKKMAHYQSNSHAVSMRLHEMNCLEDEHLDQFITIIQYITGNNECHCYLLNWKSSRNFVEKMNKELYSLIKDQILSKNSIELCSVSEKTVLSN